MIAFDVCDHLSVINEFTEHEVSSESDMDPDDTATDAGPTAQAKKRKRGKLN